jgi:hypothetical protein
VSNAARNPRSTHAKFRALSAARVNRARCVVVNASIASLSARASSRTLPRRPVADVDVAPATPSSPSSSSPRAPSSRDVRWARSSARSAPSIVVIDRSIDRSID